MSALSCAGFRAELARALVGRPATGRLSELAWHEHLLGCSGCRELLEAEEALEALLATLPDPQLPPELSRRVLARLRTEADEAEGSAVDADRRLDSLLALDPTPAHPAGLAEGVLAGLDRARTGEDGLDRLLERVPPPEIPEGLAGSLLAHMAPRRERIRANRALSRLLDRLPAPRVPAGLAERVLAALDHHRFVPEPEAEAGRRPMLRVLASAQLWAAAAVVLATCALAFVLWRSGPGRAAGEARPAVADGGDPAEQVEQPDAVVVSPDPVDPRDGGSSEPDPTPDPVGPPVEQHLVDAGDPVAPTPGPNPELDEPDEGMLALLDVLSDDWDILMERDVNALLGTLTPTEEVLVRELEVVDAEGSWVHLLDAPDDEEEG